MDWQLTCRVCLDLESGDMVSLFDCDENNEQLGDKYNFCCGVEVSRNDSLPTLICLNCVDQLTYAYQFKQQCLTSNNTLKECLEEFKNSEARTIGNTSRELSQYQLKTPKSNSQEREAEDLTLATRSLKQDHDDTFSYEGFGSADDDLGFDPVKDESESEAEAKEEELPPPRKRTRPHKVTDRKAKLKTKEDKDVLLKNTTVAPSKKKHQAKKKYVYEKSHHCETCGSSFRFNALLQAHIRRHLGIKPFVCSECGFACVMREELKRHMQRHTGERPHKCRICDRRFGDHGARQKHERLHMGVRPYKCTLCDRTFTYSYVLASHMLTHSKKKKYSCGSCDKKFTKPTYLKQHIKVHHKDLYHQQQLEQKAKKLRERIHAKSLSGVLLGKIVDGTFQLTRAKSEDREEAQIKMLVTSEDSYDDSEKKTTAVSRGRRRAKRRVKS